MKTIYLATLALFIGHASFCQSNIRITLVDVSNSHVTLTNFGNEAQNVSNHWLCNFPAYDQINTLQIVEGNEQVQPGESVKYLWSDISGINGELGYYSTNSFSQSSAMLDYMEWGSGFHQRESLAVSNGYWTSGGFASGLPPYGFFGQPDEYGPDFWSQAESKVRIVKVDTDLNHVHLTNFSATLQDLSLWELCNFPDYETMSGSSYLTGGVIIGPFETVIIEWEDLTGDDGEMGLYQFADFNSPLAMVDYMEWGSGGHFRESVAVNKGIWSTGDFSALGNPYCFDGWSDDIGISFWSSTIVGCIYTNAANFNSLATIDDGQCIFDEGCLGDLTNDEVVDTGDLLAFLTFFGTSCL